MLRNRICYLLLLLATGLFFLCFNGYLSLYVFALSLAIPPASLLLSLPGMLSLRLRLTSEAAGGKIAWAEKGTGVPLRLTARCRSPLPLGPAKLRLTVRNSLTGEERREWLLFTAGAKPLVLEHLLRSSACGLTICSLSRGKVCDMLGLFALPLRLKGRYDCGVFFYPRTFSPTLTVREVTVPDSGGERYSPHRPGEDPSELFGLRDYRPGDRLSRIHWKLSQKTGKTLVRELSLPLARNLLFLADLNGAGEQSDTLMDVLATLSGFLCREEVPHLLGFQDGQGLFSLEELAGLEDTRPVWESLLSNGGPLPALAREDLPEGISHLLYLCASPNQELLALLAARYPSAKLTLLQAVGESAFPEVHPPAGAEVIAIPPNRVQEALNGFLL